MSLNLRWLVIMIVSLFALCALGCSPSAEEEVAPPKGAEAGGAPTTQGAPAGQPMTGPKPASQ